MTKIKKKFELVQKMLEEKLQDIDELQSALTLASFIMAFGFPKMFEHSRRKVHRVLDKVLKKDKQGG